MKWHLWLGLAVGLTALVLLGMDNLEIEDDGPYSPVVTPSEFGTAASNPYMPLVPGTTFVYEGATDSGFEHIEVLVTHDTKTILGVECVVVRDTVWIDGEMVEDTYDWYAVHQSGDVWYFGEDSKEYESGIVVSTAGSWEAGVDGALPGIIMPAAPDLHEEYRQEYYAGEAEDMAEALSVQAAVSTASGDYAGCLQTKEWTPLDRGALEHKFYAPGVGMVKEVVAKGGWGEIDLVEVRSE